MALPRSSTSHLADQAGAHGAPEVYQAAGAKSVVIPGADFIIAAQYGREGSNLVLKGADGREAIVRDYFAQIEPPQLETENGARIPAELAERLAGPLAPAQYAQASEIAQAAVPIGQVQALTGSATATRASGARVDLANGAPVFAGDIVETASGSRVGIIFIDKTTVALGEGARLTLDQLVFNPQTKQGASLMSLLQGAFVVVTGEIAQANPQAVQFNTPVGTIGIRGTEFGATIAQVLGQSIVTLFAGAIAITNAVGQVVLNTPGLTTLLTSFNLAPLQPFSLPQGQVDQIFGTLQGLSQILAPFTRGTTPGQQQQQQNEPGPTPAEVQFAQSQTPQAGGDGQNPLPQQLQLPPQIVTASLGLPGLPELLTPQSGLGPLAALAILGLIDPSLRPEKLGNINIVLPGDGAVSNGTDGPDLIIGSDGPDLIAGLAGNDRIFARGGDDVIVWRDGDDNDTIDGGAGNDVLIASGSEGADTLVIREDGGRVAFFGAGSEAFDLDLVGVEEIIYSAGGGADSVFVGSLAGTDISDSTIVVDLGADSDKFGAFHSTKRVIVDGGEGSDIIAGGLANDALLGGAGNDLLYGAGGDDVIDGGAGDDRILWRAGDGNDLVIGGAGRDLLAMASDQTPDEIVVDPGENGIEVAIAGTVQTIAGIEDLVLKTNAGDDVVTVGDFSGVDTAPTVIATLDAGDDTLDASGAATRVLATGGVGADTLIGGAAGDILMGDVGEDVLEGNDGDDALAGGEDHDHLAGGLGDDLIDGGAGDDVIGYAAGDGSDRIAGGAGDDSLEVTGGSDDDEISIVIATPALIGAETLALMTVNGALSRASGIEQWLIATDAGDDIVTIDGLTGVGPWAPIPAVGLGEFAPVIAAATAGAAEIEAFSLEYLEAIGGGLSAGFSLGQLDVLPPSSPVHFHVDLGAGDDQLDASTAKANIEADGGEGDDTLLGGSGADGLAGGAGEDTLAGGKGDDQIDAGSGDDLIVWKAGDGHDHIDGKAGADKLEIDFRDEATPTDHVIAIANDGSDNLIVTVDGAPTPVIVAVGVEELEIWLGAGDDHLTIGDLAGTGIAKITIHGGGGDDVIDTTACGIPVHVFGDAGDDTIHSGGGDDHLSGGAGADVMDGDGGRNTYDIDDPDDQIVGNPGIDTVVSSVSHTLGNLVDNLILTGTADNVATGNTLDNVIDGNDGENRLTGGQGSDVMNGGLGSDTYVYLNPGNVAAPLIEPGDGLIVSANRPREVNEFGDLLLGFKSGVDFIEIDAEAFGFETDDVTEIFAVIAGAYDGTNATGSAYDEDRPSFVYSEIEATLYYDPNGSDPGYTIVATVSAGEHIEASDIKLVASA